MNKEGYFEDRLCVSQGYFSEQAIERMLGFSPLIKRKYQLARYYICMSMGGIWQERRFCCKPTSRQVRQVIKEFKLYVESELVGSGL